MNSEKWVQRGEELLAELRYAEAEEAYRRAIDIDPQYAFAWNNLGVALRNQGKNPEAEEAFRRAIGIDPQDARVWTNLGVALGDQDKNPEAEEAYQRAIGVDPQHAGAWNGLGVALGEQGKQAEAVEAFRRAIGIDPQDALAWTNLGYALLYLDRCVEAEQAARRAIALHPGFYRTYSARALIAESRGKQEKPPVEVLHAYRRMAGAIEGSRLDRPGWEDRLEEFRSPSRSLRAAAGFCIGAVPPYPEDALRFAIQSKARTLGELRPRQPAGTPPFIRAGEAGQSGKGRDCSGDGASRLGYGPRGQLQVHRTGNQASPDLPLPGTRAGVAGPEERPGPTT